MYTDLCGWDSSVLIREVSFIQSVLYREVLLYQICTLELRTIALITQHKIPWRIDFSSFQVENVRRSFVIFGL